MDTGINNILSSNKLKSLWSDSEDSKTKENNNTRNLPNEEFSFIKFWGEIQTQTEREFPNIDIDDLLSENISNLCVQIDSGESNSPRNKKELVEQLLIYERLLDSYLLINSISKVE